MTAPLNRPFQVGATVNSLTYPELAPTMREVFDLRAKAYSLGCYAVKDLGPDSRSFTWKQQGANLTDPYYKAKGADRTYTTNVKNSTTISHDEPIYKDEAIDWYEANVLPGWNVIGPAVKRTLESQINLWEKRHFRLLGSAAQASDSSGITSGGVNVSRTGAGTNFAAVQAAYAFSSTGADNFLDDAASLAYKFNDRRERRGSNVVMFVPAYIRSVVTRSTRFMSKDYNDRASLPFGAFGEIIEGMPVVDVPIDLWPVGNITTDAVSTYNYDFSAGGSTLGVPAALIACWDSEFAPVGMVRHGGFIADMWKDNDTDTNKVGTKACYGLGTLDVHCAGALFVHN